MILRSNGTPMFLLANVVDDADMGITHVIRGEDHVNGTPKYLLLARRARLRLPARRSPTCRCSSTSSARSCRSGATTSSVGDYRGRGYLPEAMVNYLALLGWGPDDGVEVRPIEEIVELFRLEDVTLVAGVLRHQEAAARQRRVHPGARRRRVRATRPRRSSPAGEPARAALASLAIDVRDRVRTLDEVGADDRVPASTSRSIDEASWDKAMVEGKAAAEMLDAADRRPGRSDDERWRRPTIRDAVEAAAVTAGLVNAEGKPQLSKAQGPVRVAVSGRTVGPPLFESLAVLGRDRTLARLRAARERVG